MVLTNASLPPPLSAELEDSAEATPSALSGNNRLGRYRLCYELASGGMATVFLARVDGPKGFDKIVALKRIHPHLAREATFVKMFLDEARLVARINHPNVCNVFDFGESDGIYYIAMEFLAGEPLSKVLRAIWAQPWQKDSPMLPFYAARIIADACEGLHSAHELTDSSGELLNLVHRDVSPHNLFVTFQGGVKVVDFGIASARNRLHHTATGEVKGKFAYMAPEQLRGKVVDRRADVWALGVVLWEMIVMKRLFRRGTEMETIFAVASDKIPLPSSLRPNVPKDLEEVIMRALTRDIDQRYLTARHFGRDLLQFISSHGKLIGPSDIGDWLNELFPDGSSKKEALIEAARHEKSSRPLPADADDESSSNVLSVIDTQMLKKANSIEMMAKEGQKKGSASKLAWIIPAAASLVVALVAGFFALRSHKDPPRAVVTELKPQTESKAQATTPINPTQPIPTKEPQQTKTPTTKLAPPTQEPAPTPPVVINKPTAKTSTANDSALAVLNVRTVGGWAYVLENGKRLGQTPLRIEVKAGTHELEIRPFGEPPATRIKVDLKPGQVEVVSVPIGN